MTSGLISEARRAVGTRARLARRDVPVEPRHGGEFDELSKARRRKNRVVPMASRLIAMPTTTWSARVADGRQRVERRRRDPTRDAPSKPTQGDARSSCLTRRRSAGEHPAFERERDDAGPFGEHAA